MPTHHRLALAVAAAALALTSCSGPDPAPTASSSTSTPASPPTTQPGASEETTRPATTAGSIGDGTWVAGPVPDVLRECTPQSCAQARQIQPGRYHTVADVGPGCYWWVTPVEHAGWWRYEPTDPRGGIPGWRVWRSVRDLVAGLAVRNLGADRLTCRLVR